MTDPDETIDLTVRIVGEWTITVDRAGYEAAKDAGAVDDFLDAELSNLNGENIIVEPDGRSYNPFQQPAGPPPADGKCRDPYNCTCEHGCDIP
jgi:hypothetical protein